MAMPITRSCFCSSLTLLFLLPYLGGDGLGAFNQVRQSFQDAGPLLPGLEFCRIFLKGGGQHIGVTGFEEHHIAGWVLGVVLADGVVHAVLVQHPFKVLDTALGDVDLLRPLVFADQLLHGHLAVVALHRLARLDLCPVLGIFAERATSVRPVSLLVLIIRFTVLFSISSCNIHSPFP